VDTFLDLSTGVAGGIPAPRHAFRLLAVELA
jgi:hypothetical protein